VLVLSQPEFTDAVRQVLRDLHRPDLLGRNALLRTRLLREHCGGEPSAAALAELVRAAAETLGAHPRDDKRLQAVEQTYLQPAGTQEAAALRLGLPFSTYRRHLTEGVERVVTWLWEREVYGPRGCACLSRTEQRPARRSTTAPGSSVETSEEAEMTGPLGDRAVVLGASVAGLLAARVHADAYGQVVVIERDDLPEDAMPRRGVPQARHAHALLARGQQVLEDLFPGFTAELLARGVPTADMLAGTRMHLRAHRCGRHRAGWWQSAPAVRSWRTKCANVCSRCPR
jgi:hypothetical protein